MTFEEAVLKLKVDLGQVEPALQDFKGKVNDAVGNSHKSFVRLGGETRAFKKTLQEVAEQSPMLGTALRLALNPIVGILLGATMALNKFLEAQKEAVARANELGNVAARQQVAGLEAIFSDDPQKARRAAAMAAAKEKASKGVDAFLEEARSNIRKSGRFTKTEISMWGETSGPFADATVAEAERLRNAAVNRFVQLQAEEAIIRQREKDQRKYIENADEMYRVDKLRDQILEEQAQELEKVAEKERKLADAREKASLKKLTRAISFEAQYMPTLEELAGSGAFTQQARYIQWLEAGAKQQFMWGNVKGARETIFGEGGIRDLRKQLMEAGVLKADAADVLESLSENGQLRVKVTNTE